MQRDYTKICRVCMSEGSRDIFPKVLTSADPNTSGTGATTSALTSPLERLLEKLRYVTMMKIDENDDLPRLLCDLCIVQLNVAYNFKRQAVENDTKLRQYFIENGISTRQNIVANSPQPPARNTLTAIHAQHVRVSSPHRNDFPIVPFIIKSEATSDIDVFSDETTDTNMELVANTPPVDMNLSNISNSTLESSPANESPHNQKNKIQMVYVNSCGKNRITSSSITESVQNSNAENGNESDHAISLQVTDEESPKDKEKGDGPRVVFRTSSAALQRKSMRIPDDSQKKRQKTVEVEGLTDDVFTHEMKQNREIKRLIIDMNESVFSAHKRSIKKEEVQSGKTSRILQKEPPKIAAKRDSESRDKKDTTKGKSISKENKFLLNPFNKHSPNEANIKRVKRLTKKSSEKLLRPKINPPSTNSNA